MATYVLAGPVAMPEPPASGTEGSKPASTPIDIKLDIGTLGKIFPLPPELRKLGNSGEPLELKVSLGPPGKQQNQEVAEEPESRVRSPSIYWEGGIEVDHSTPYTTYKGNGTPEQGWPTPEEWITYNSMYVF